MPMFDTPEPISATVDIALGDVRINAAERGDTVVDVAPSDASSSEDRKAAELTSVDYADGRLVVKGPKARPWLPRRGGGSVSVTIELPAGSDVRAMAAAGDLHCRGALGDCVMMTEVGRIELDSARALTIKSGKSDVSVGRARGRAEIAIASGDVRVRELDSGAAIKTADADTWVGVAGGDLRVSTANGSIAIDEARAAVSAKTAKGDLRVGEVMSGAIVLETHLGDVEIGIREGTAAWLDVRSTAGKVHNMLEAAAAPDPSAQTAEVRARTTLGDVIVRRPERAPVGA